MDRMLGILVDLERDMGEQVRYKDEFSEEMQEEGSRGRDLYYEDDGKGIKKEE